MNLSARAHKNLQSALAGALLGGLMASPRAGAAAVLNGLTAFTQGVLPFLFPFSCLAQLLPSVTSYLAPGPVRRYLLPGASLDCATSFPAPPTALH